MLTRAASSIGAVATAAILVATAAELSYAQADPTSSPSPTGSGVTCDPKHQDPRTGLCSATVVGQPSSPSSSSSSGSKGGGGGGDTKPACTKPSPDDSVPVLCFDPTFGWYDQHLHCYFKLSTPQPPATDPSWEGHKPGDGAVYDKSCWASDFAGHPLTLQLAGQQWWLNPPPGVMTPGEVAQIAIAELELHGPDIGTAPNTNGSGLVGMPVWLWTENQQARWGTHSATASVPGLSVTVTATADSILWDMGDGHQVPCDNPGKAYDPTKDGLSQPECGYTYTRPSGDQPGGKYTITGTTTWQISWVASTGETGTVPPMKLTSTTTVKIGEAQAVNQ